MDLMVLALLLLKYFGLYWLFDYKTDHEYPARQLELTLGLALCHLFLFSGYALLSGDYMGLLVSHLVLYSFAITLEGVLWLSYDRIFDLLSKKEHRKQKYYKINHVSTLDRKIIYWFNITYVTVLIIVFLTQEKIKS